MGVVWARAVFGSYGPHGRRTMAEARSQVTIEERIARVRETFEAIAREDYDKEQEGYAEDVLWHSQLRGTEFRGKEAMRAEDLKQSQESDDRLELHDVCASGEHVVALFDVIPQGASKPGHPDGRLVMVAHVNDDDKITELWSIYKPIS
jgi:ketosteroid isomerase-like protein